MNCPQKRCEPSCAFCLDANEPFLAAPLIFLFSYNARTGYQRSAKRECRQGLRIVRYHFFEKAGKRLSCGPAIFAKKLQKSRETYNFTAFYGGPNRDRTDDLTDANRTLSQSVWSYPPKTIANTVEEVSLQSLCVEGCMTSNNYCTRQTFYNSASV